MIIFNNNGFVLLSHNHDMRLDDFYLRNENHQVIPCNLLTTNINNNCFNAVCLQATAKVSIWFPDSLSSDHLTQSKATPPIQPFLLISCSYRLTVRPLVTFFISFFRSSPSPLGLAQALLNVLQSIPRFHSCTVLMVEQNWYVSSALIASNTAHVSP